MSFNISFDYRFDATGFFTDSVRNALEAAGAAWEAVIQDEFQDVPAGITFDFESPTNAPTKETVTLETGIDDLRIFVGAQNPPFGETSGNALARGGTKGFSASGDVLQSRIASDFNGNGPVTNFEPFAGAISFDPTRDWSFDVDAPQSGKHDFLSVAVHEIGHVLGIGQAEIFNVLGEGGSFDGPNARSINGGEPIPLSSDIAHTASSFQDGDVLMSPGLTEGTRQMITDADKALLADIGYEIEGFTAEGTTPDITTDGDDGTVFGTVVGDLLNGFGGGDQIQGDLGNDTIYGGAGDDNIFGQEGDDRIFAGRGNDTVQGGGGADLIHAGPGSSTVWGEGTADTESAGADTFYIAPGDLTENVLNATVAIEDFELGSETILVDPAFGFESTGAILDTLSKTFSNISRFDLTPEASGGKTYIDVRHVSQSGTPLTEADFEIGRPSALNGARVNAKPLARDDQAVLIGDSITIEVLANDGDPDGDDLTPIVTRQPDSGSVQTLVTGEGDAFTFTPNDTFTGSTSFDYVLSDGNGALDEATVTITDTASAASLDLFSLSLAERASALYLGYFGRAADPAGLTFWENELDQAVTPVADGGKGVSAQQALKDMAEAVRKGEEAIDLFPIIDPQRDVDTISQSDIEAFVNAVFDNLFNRNANGTPDDAATGLGYWVQTLQNRFDQGINIGDAIVDIISGAQGDDVAAFSSKLDVAKNFTENMDQDRFDALSDGPATARELIAEVGRDAESVTSALRMTADTGTIGTGAAFAPTDDIFT